MTEMTRDDIRVLVGQAQIAMQEALKRHGLNSDAYRATLDEYVRLSAALAAAPQAAASPVRSYRATVTPGRCSHYTRANGCPLHGETCAPEYR